MPKFRYIHTVKRSKIREEEEKKWFKMLPDEMWEEILKHVDVFDLLRLRRVSKSFRAMIDRVIKRDGKWYEKCVKEVPKKYWTSILEHHTNPELTGSDYYRSRNNSRIWIGLYESWIGWNNLIDKMTRQRSFNVSPGATQFITSFSVSSNIIAIGICDRGGNSGYVAVYDITQLNKGPIYMSDQQRDFWGAAVRDVQVWRKDDHVKVVSCDNNGVQHWNVVPLLDRPKTKVYPPNKASLISANLGYCYTLEDTYVPANNEAEDETDKRCAMTIERLPDLDSRTIRWNISDNSYNYAIGADGDKVILLSIDDLRDYLIIDEISAKSGELTNLSKIHALPHVCHGSEIFKPCVVACLNDDTSEIGFSVDGRQLKFYNSVRDLKLISDVTSFYYHIGLLILGLESGELCIVYVKDADRLEKLNLETMRCKILRLDKCGITRLAVTEYNSSQYIVATTDENLHLVEFY